MTHPAERALSILLGQCDGAVKRDNVGMNGMHAQAWRDGQRDPDWWVHRLHIYRRQIGDELAEECRAYAASLQTGPFQLQNRQSSDGCLYVSVPFSRKDEAKEAVFQATGKRALIWDPDCKGWKIPLRFISQVIASGKFVEAEPLEQAIQEEIVRYSSPKSAPLPAKPAIVLNEFDESKLGLASTLRPFQVDGCKVLSKAIESGGALLADDMGLGKGLTLSHVVPTLGGMGIRIKDIKIGDEVIGSDGRATKVTGVYPQGKQVVYQITFRDGATVVCDGAHLWNVSDYNSSRRERQGLSKWRTLSTETLFSMKLTVGPKDSPRFHLPLVAPVEHPYKNLPMDPYLLGMLIANGCFTEHVTSVAVTINKEDKDVISRMPKGTHFNEKPGCVAGIIKGVMPVLEELIGRVRSAEKSLPKDYLCASVEQRKDLLAGLMDGDGCSSNNRISYHTRSEQLAKDVKELVSSLGGIGIIHRYGEDYQVNVKTLFNPFFSRRKSAGWKATIASHGPVRSIVSIKKLPGKQETTCISVAAKDKLFVCGSDYVLTHNTVASIAIAIHSNMPMAVICPAALRYNWVAEIFKHHSSKTVFVVNDKTSPRSRASVFRAKVSRFSVTAHAADVIIIGYEACRDMVVDNDDPNTAKYATMKKMIAPEWREIMASRLCVVDEAHYAKSTKAQRTQNASAIMRACRRVLAMTGTPVNNRPLEIWPILCAIGRNREVCKNKDEFYQEFVERGNLPELHRRLMRGGWYVRRLKVDVLKDLPPKQRTELAVAMPSMIQDEYDKMLDGLAADGTTVACQLAVMTNLQTIANKAKIVPVADLIEERMEAGLKTVVSSTRTEALEMLSAELNRRNVTNESIIGGTSPSERTAIMDRFQTTDEPNVILTTVQEGITLTAADTLVLLDLPWTPGSITQREDRIYRIGQMNTVTIIRVIAASIDTHKVDIIAKKQEMASTILDGKHIEITNLDVDLTGDVLAALREEARQRKGLSPLPSAASA